MTRFTAGAISGARDFRKAPVREAHHCSRRGAFVVGAAGSGCQGTNATPRDTRELFDRPAWLEGEAASQAAAHSVGL